MMTAPLSSRPTSRTLLGLSWTRYGAASLKSIYNLLAVTALDIVRPLLVHLCFSWLWYALQACNGTILCRAASTWRALSPAEELASLREDSLQDLRDDYLLLAGTAAGK